jgi:hypothetical protein
MEHHPGEISDGFNGTIEADAYGGHTHVAIPTAGGANR